MKRSGFKIIRKLKRFKPSKPNTFQNTYFDRSVWFVSVLTLGALATVSSKAHADDDGTGLQSSVSVDLTGTAGSTEKNNPRNAFFLREAEVSLYAPIDQIFDGLLSVAAHREGGTYFFEVHEATVSSSKLIPLSRFRIGQFFLGVGKLNSTHRHDWPFISAPKMHATFFGEEGVLDTGGEFSVLLPVPFYLDLTVGLTNGWTYGHSHNEGAQPKTPLHYLRAVNYFELPADGGLQTGLNYLGRTDSKKAQLQLFGLDAVAKWRDGEKVAFLLQSEIWLRYLKPDKGTTNKTLGFYVYPQAHVGSGLDLGLRADGYTILSLNDVTGKKVSNFDGAFVPTVTWKPSEFSTFRVAYNAETTQLSSAKTKLQRRFFELQSSFILGAHPAHDF